MSNEKEIKNPGILLAVIKKICISGIMHAFYVCSYGLFPDPDLGKFGLKHCLKELFSYCT